MGKVIRVSIEPLNLPELMDLGGLIDPKNPALKTPVDLEEAVVGVIVRLPEKGFQVTVPWHKVKYLQSELDPGPAPQQPKKVATKPKPSPQRPVQKRLQDEQPTTADRPHDGDRAQKPTPSGSP